MRDSTALIIYIAAMILIFIVAATQVSAQTCTGWDDLRDRLVAEWGEDLRGIGLAPDGSILAITAAPDGATWSAIRVLPDGSACLFASGESWIDFTPPPTLPGEEH